MTPVELALIHHTFKSKDGIPIGNITLTMGISIKDASSAFRNLKRQGLMDAPNGSLKITKLGRDWVMENQHLFIFSHKKNWRETPDIYIDSRIGAFEPYAPRISKLNKFFFNIGGRKIG